METTKFALMTALFTGGSLVVHHAFKTKKVLDIVNGVEREDGSNRSFNVKGIDANGQNVTLYVRTID